MKRKGFICFLGFALLLLWGVPVWAEDAPTVAEQTAAVAEETPVVVEQAPAAAAEETPAAEAEAAPSVALAEQDCAKCHAAEAKDVKANGALHADVGCLECHPEHPPAGKETIYSCDMCHGPDDSAHYTLKDCIVCHYPHHPRAIDFAKVDPIKAACLTCHAEQGTEMESRPSAHADLDCKECHLEHKQWLECGECHEAHAPEMAHKDCLSCHKPHSPAEVTYNDSVPNNFCACCHEDVGSGLAESKKAHGQMGCVECHESEHTAASACDACHDANLHGTFMHEKYPNCLDCHKDPHALAE